MCIYVFLLELISFIYYHFSLYGYLISLVYFYKLVFLFCLYFFLSSGISNDKITGQELCRYMIISGLMYSFILITSTLLGISESTYYEGSFGTKGLFSSGNGLSLFLGVCAALALKQLSRKKRTVDFLVFIFLFIAATIVGTKASIVFFIFNSLFFFFFVKWPVKIIISISVVFLIFYFEIDQLLSLVFEVIIERYQKSESLIAFLSSGRDTYYSNALKEYNTDGIRFVRFLFGAGGFVSFRSRSASFLVLDTLERDVLDIFFMYGILGLSFYFFYYIRNIIHLIKSNELYFFSIFTMIFVYSAIAGHVVFNSMSGVTLVIIPLIVLSKHKKDENEDRHGSPQYFI